MSAPSAASTEAAIVRSRGLARLNYGLAALALAVYVADVLLGKAGVALKFVPPFRLGEVAEFLVVLVAMVFFVTGLLAESGVPVNKPVAIEEES